jgi:hypothetical protein
VDGGHPGHPLGGGCPVRMSLWYVFFTDTCPRAMSDLSKARYYKGLDKRTCLFHLSDVSIARSTIGLAACFGPNKRTSPFVRKISTGVLLNTKSPLTLRINSTPACDDCEELDWPLLPYAEAKTLGEMYSKQLHTERTNPTNPFRRSTRGRTFPGRRGCRNRRTMNSRGGRRRLETGLQPAQRPVSKGSR